MKLMKKFMLVLLIIISSFVNTSCWDYKDVERLNVVMSFAIDKDTKSNEYILTVEVARPESGQNQAKYMSDIYESRGNTIFEAIRNLIPRIGKKAYWSHVSIGILGKAVAGEDVGSAIDFFYRDPEARGDMYILISKRETAKEILLTNHNPQELRAIKLRYVMENQKSSKKFPKTQLREIIENLQSKNKAILVPTIDFRASDDGLVTEINGSAVLKQDKVVGYLTPEETQYALWAMGKIDGGVLVVQNIIGDNNITFEIFGNKTKIKTDYIDNNAKIKVDIAADVSIGEVSNDVKFEKEEVKEQIRNEAERYFEDKVQYIIKKMQNECKSDVFSFGKKFEIQNRGIWKKIKPTWSEEFLTAAVEVNVKLEIKGSAMTSRPIKEESGK
ncbi:Ger(x)C family spore germination protein [Clostridium swellfunianum]|uniref:Ger(x)C family spore germination protein n=1 Tax=Clostridium swellfunianum TaxID=1367462 RepID=UPI00203084C9|nr:Ger(x)C family spore germination protein [Clostridium swellfunianum]MCM0647860.1 Ger(x)C family spore germination protein [Clostridium swellfunianum]